MVVAAFAATWVLAVVAMVAGVALSDVGTGRMGRLLLSLFMFIVVANIVLVSADGILPGSPLGLQAAMQGTPKTGDCFPGDHC